MFLYSEGTDVMEAAEHEKPKIKMDLLGHQCI